MVVCWVGVLKVVVFDDDRWGERTVAVGSRAVGSRWWF
jgi:hypothetical protein